MTIVSSSSILPLDFEFNGAVVNPGYFLLIREHLRNHLIKLCPVLRLLAPFGKLFSAAYLLEGFKEGILQACKPIFCAYRPPAFTFLKWLSNLPCHAYFKQPVSM